MLIHFDQKFIQNYSCIQFHAMHYIFSVDEWKRMVKGSRFNDFSQVGSHTEHRSNANILLVLTHTDHILYPRCFFHQIKKKSIILHFI